jgi:hypothetical protein
LEVPPPLGVLKPEDKHFIKFAYFDAVNTAKENSLKNKLFLESTVHRLNIVGDAR